MLKDPNNWKKLLRLNPVTPLILSDDKAINYFICRDILDEDPGIIESLWESPKVKSILDKQQENGSWKYSGGKEEIRSQMNYNQLETYRIMRVLIEKYGLNNTNNAISKACEFLFSFQTEEGDFRGIYGNEYTPNYSAGIMEMLIKAGYEKDDRIDLGLNWLLSIRQNDGGWAIPFRTTKCRISDVFYKNEQTEPIKNDPTKPSSHLVTGIVLRAFATHGHYRKSNDLRKAGAFLKSQFFKKDNYPDHGSPDYWGKLAYPFWWTDIVSSLDSLSKLKFNAEDYNIKTGLDYLINNQRSDGTWKVYYGLPKDDENDLWITLAICRLFKRFYSI
ncbi:MAG: Prenyltransferase and squalene oxidase repeat protein [Candidatus Methanofastidiosum methylothiophilum]|uniref:Prenyltransferase and squalene oxidase repeat protein n=1 Tax=Candidatus Methanofastidiosum methylothiophilum TaxID=1705564 RepID=A0A150IUP1_9EURY|nr:MAG: Prenyltransferase and squalene oxidase repeat protein [Candidatus Methanofastidiosum methylthiophilus]